jgi:hypothetical protein
MAYTYTVSMQRTYLYIYVVLACMYAVALLVAPLCFAVDFMSKLQAEMVYCHISCITGS